MEDVTSSLLSNELRKNGVDVDAQAKASVAWEDQKIKATVTTTNVDPSLEQTRNILNASTVIKKKAHHKTCPKWKMKGIDDKFSDVSVIAEDG